MSRGLKVSIVLSVFVWLCVVLNAVLYIAYEDLVNLLAFFWCLAMATWSTYSTLSTWSMEREF